MTLSSMLPIDGRNEPMPVLYYRNLNGTANTFASTVSTTAVRLGPLVTELGFFLCMLMLMFIL